MARWIDQLYAESTDLIKTDSFEKFIPQGFFDQLKTALGKNKALKKFSLAYTSSTTDPMPMAEQVVMCSVALTGINSNLYICVPSEFIQKICEIHISEETSVDFEFLSAFAKFLVLEALLSASGVPPLNKTPPTLLNIQNSSERSFKDLDTEGSLKTTITCTFGEITIPVVLLFPKTFQNSWQKYWLSSEFETHKKQEAIFKKQISLSVEIGNTNITQDQLNNLAPGDWIYLSNHGFDSNSGIATVQISLNNSPICSGNFDGNVVHIKSIFNS